MIGLIIFYLIGFIIVFCGYILLMKDLRGYVIFRDILNASTVAIISWIAIIAVLIVYFLNWLEEKVDWNKKLF